MDAALPLDNSPVEKPPLPVETAGSSGIGIGRALYLGFIFYLIFVAVVLLGTTLTAMYGLADNAQLNQLLVLLIPQFFAWLVTIQLAQLRFHQPLAKLAWLKPFPLRIVPALVTASFGAQILLSEMTSRILPMPQWLKDFVVAQRESGPVLASLLAVALVAPVAEEIFFRGLMLRGFLARYSVAKSVATSAILFSLFHLNPWQMLPALPLGLWFAWMVLRTGSVLPGMLSHAVVNFSGLFLMVPLMQLLGYPDDMWKEIDHLPPLIIAIGAVTAFVGGALLWWQLRDRTADVSLAAITRTVVDPQVPLPTSES